MAGGLIGLLDDVAALAKAAAASVDDVGAAAGRAAGKAAGVVVDDTAVTPQFVSGVHPSRELPMVGRIAAGSLRNKLVFILPAVLALTEFVPALVPLLLIAGGGYLSYEGAHKIFGSEEHHDAPAVLQGAQREEELVGSAVRTDFVLSVEIMVIAAEEVLEETLVMRALVLIVVALVITAGVYGSVAAIVRMDDLGLRLAERDTRAAVRLGRLMVKGMSRLLDVLTVVGTAAMLWVGGHIVLTALDDLSVHAPYALVHDAGELAHGLPLVGGVARWLAETALSASAGLSLGLLVERGVHVAQAVGDRRREPVAKGDERETKKG